MTPRQGEQSPRYDHNFDASANTVFFRANNRPEAVFEQFGGRTKEMSDNRKFIVRADNRFDDLTPREMGDDSRSEYFKQNEDAYHEQDLGVREVGDKEYWVNRDGAYFSDNDFEYSDLSARSAAGQGRGRPGKYERDEAHNFIMAKPNPVAGQDTHRPSDRQMEAS